MHISLLAVLMRYL